MASSGLPTARPPPLARDAARAPPRMASGPFAHRDRTDLFKEPAAGRSCRASPRAMAQTWRMERELEGSLSARPALSSSMWGEGGPGDPSLSARISDLHKQQMASMSKNEQLAKELRATQVAHEQTQMQVEALDQAHEKLSVFGTELESKLHVSEDTVRELSRRLRTETAISAALKKELEVARHRATEEMIQYEYLKQQLKDRDDELESKLS